MTESNTPAMRAQPALVEIVERKRRYDPDSEQAGEHLIRPNEVRINGTPLLVPAGETITVHDLSLNNDDLVQVTLTLWARRVVVQSEEATEDPDHAAVDGERPFREQTAREAGLTGNPR